MQCRFCRAGLEDTFIDLGSTPLSNAFRSAEQLAQPEVFLPLKLWVCRACFLVQVNEFERPEHIFDSSYAYFSSYSTTWLEHAAKYADMIVERLDLTPSSLVVEIASNDGYLLKNFKQRGIGCLGVEPAANTAAAARALGLEVISEFFGEKLAGTLADERGKADLLIGNNVLAHVPDINDFVRGLRTALRQDGTITMEFPHLLRLVEGKQFDTIYHEHFSYLSLHVVKRIFAAHDLRIYDVEELDTHGGSLRIYACCADYEIAAAANVERLLKVETAAGMCGLAFYGAFQNQADGIKYDFLSFLLQQKKAGKKVVGYGAAAKANTLMNYCGLKADLIEFIVDASPHKQGTFAPGSHIPVVDEQRIGQLKPDFIIVFPWNIRREIMDQLNYIREWGGDFVLPIPQLEIC